MQLTFFAALALTTIGCKPHLGSISQLRGVNEGDRDYGSKSTYPQGQNLDDYESPPPGYKLSFVQILSRHSSRGLSSASDDLIMLDFLQQADEKKALTPLGVELLPDMKKMVRINANLGKGLPEIQKPGYGNLSARGMKEHRGLGERLYRRQKEFFTALPRSGKTIEFLTSGENRAQDSAGLFTASLVSRSPDLAAILKPAIPLVSGSEEPGVDHFMLYFHKLDKVADVPPPDNAVYARVLADSLAYQEFKDATDPGSLSAKLTALKETPESLAAAKRVFEGLVSKEFIAEIESGNLSFSNAPADSGDPSPKASPSKASKKDTATASTDPAQPAVAKEKKEKVKTAKTLYDLIDHFYGVYSICPGLSEELGGKNFEKYFPEKEADLFTSLSDLDDFYNKGPSTIESKGVTSNMARGLLANFFDETDAVVAGTQTRGALLRFAHAETVIPFSTTLGVSRVDKALPAATTYSYKTSKWRGRSVTPLAVNVQWEVYQQASGGPALVKLLYSEKEADFREACASAKFPGTESYYDYAKLKACYYQ